MQQRSAYGPTTGYSANRQSNADRIPGPGTPGYVDPYRAQAHAQPTTPYIVNPRGQGLDWVNGGNGTNVHVSTLSPEAQTEYWNNIWSSGMFGPNPNAPAANTNPMNAPPVNQGPMGTPQIGPGSNNVSNPNSGGTANSPAYVMGPGGPMPVPDIQAFRSMYPNAQLVNADGTPYGGSNTATQNNPTNGSVISGRNSGLPGDITVGGTGSGTGASAYAPSFTGGGTGTNAKDPSTGGIPFTPGAIDLNSSDWFSTIARLIGGINTQQSGQPALGQGYVGSTPIPAGTNLGPTTRVAPVPTGGVSTAQGVGTGGGYAGSGYTPGFSISGGGNGGNGGNGGGLINSIGRGMGNVGNAVGNTISGVGNTVQSILGNLISGAGGGNGNSIGNTISGIGNAVNGLISSVGNGGSGFGASLGALGQGILGGLGNMGNGLMSGLSSVGSGVGGALARIWEAFMNLLSR